MSLSQRILTTGPPLVASTAVDGEPTGLYMRNDCMSALDYNEDEVRTYAQSPKSQSSEDE